MDMKAIESILDKFVANKKNKVKVFCYFSVDGKKLVVPTYTRELAKTRLATHVGEWEDDRLTVLDTIPPLSTVLV